MNITGDVPCRLSPAGEGKHWCHSTWWPCNWGILHVVLLADFPKRKALSGAAAGMLGEVRSRVIVCAWQGAAFFHATGF